MSKYTFTEENYLKAIYHLSQNSSKGVSTNAIAKRLDTKAGTVTDMLKKLGEKKLLEYQKYHGARLTTEGSKIAIGIVRKHRLWEVFMVDKLAFGWDEVHEVAEQLEHIQSPMLTNRLEEFLGFPQFDPHGDPIPDKNGKLPERSNRTLDECSIGEDVRIDGVKDTSREFLQYLEKLQLKPGNTISVSDIESFDRSMTILLRDQKISLSALACKNIYVRTLT